MTIRLATNSQRTLALGRTGSGKSIFGAWLLSVSPFHLQPYIIIDYKGEEFFAGVDRIRRLELSDKIPTRPGVYIVQPRPEIDDEIVNEFLYRVWTQGNTGLFFDEAYMVPTNGGAVQGILTQGRSLRIPVIALAQRPAWLSRFFFSEADFYAVFHLNDADDRAKVQRFVNGDIQAKLPDYHSSYYDVGKDAFSILAPVPDPATIQQTLHDRLRPEKTRFM